VKLSHLVKELDLLSPFELQEEWDNSGLLVGDPNEEVGDIVVSIDIDQTLIDSVADGSVIITHHPLIFSKFKTLQFDSYPAKLIQTMIKRDIAHIAMHTNFDQTHLNRYVATHVLGFDIDNEAKVPFVMYADVDQSFEQMADHVSTVLNLEQSKVVTTSKPIRRVALTTGSGASLLSKVDADLFLTGDIKYHDAMLAKALGVGMIDIGHYESEQFFAQILTEELKKFDLTAIISNSKNPFKYY
jgi:dinuclear metal center YbgI/SA1388 family protein